MQGDSSERCGGLRCTSKTPTLRCDRPLQWQLRFRTPYAIITQPPLGLDNPFTIFAIRLRNRARFR